MAKFQYYTAEALDKLKAELHYLKITGRLDMAKQIAEARDKGDWRENAEYDAAKEAQGLLELKISKLEEIVSVARVLDESTIDLSIVSIYSIVQIRNTKSGISIEESHSHGPALERVSRAKRPASQLRRRSGSHATE